MCRCLTFLCFLISSVAPSQPFPRHLERIAYNSKDDKLLVYGGGALVNGRLVLYDTLHEWTTGGWRAFHLSVNPPTRVGGALIFHQREQVAYLLGGVHESADTSYVLNDIWTWNGIAWTEINTETPINNIEAIYDEKAGRILAYGQHPKSKKYELWAFKERNWTKLSDTGPQWESATPLAFDRDHNSLVLCDTEGGKIVLWEWRRSGWNKLNTVGDSPPARTRFTLTYHLQEKAFYIHGGRKEDKTFLNDVWKFNKHKWTEVITNGHSVPKASARSVYRKGAILEYGGAIDVNGKTILTNSIWLLEGNNWYQH